MKKEDKKLAIVFLFLIVGILSISFVSAGWWCDNFGWFCEKDSELKGELASLSPGENGLISHWKFEDNYQDSQGINHGTANGNPVFIEGKIGKAVIFDGVDDFINVNNQLPIINEITASAWIKTLGNDLFVLGERSSNSNPNIAYSLHVISDGKVMWYISDGSGHSVIFSDVTVNDGKWHFIAAKFVPNSEITIFVDNVKKTASTSLSSINNANIPFKIGSGSGSRNFNGSIDEVKIWNYALSEEEINAEYESSTCIPKTCLELGKQCGNWDNGCGMALNCGSCPTGQSCNASGKCIPTEIIVQQQKNLVSYWKFENNYQDSQGVNHGTANGVPIFVEGKVGKAVRFDGVDDFVEVQSSESLKLNKFTISNWVKADSVAGLAKYTQWLFKDSNYVFSWDHSTPGFKQSIAFYDNSSSPTWQKAQIKTVLSANTWYYITATYDGVELIIYLNGIEESRSRVGKNPSLTNVNMNIGRGRLASSSFKGVVDEVKIWNKSLTEQEVKNEYNTSKEGSCIPKTCLELGKQCGNWSDGCGITLNCGSCPTGQTCSNGICVPIKLNSILSIATIKDNYTINEQIKLTDPPDIKLPVTNVINSIVDENIISNEIIYDSEEDIITRDFLGQKIPDYNGYIIEFEKPPVIVEKKKLDEIAEKNKKFIKKNPVLSTVTGFRFVATTSEDVPKKVEKYKENLEKGNEKIKDRIADELSGKSELASENPFKKFLKKITGKAVSSESEIDSNKILSEFKTVFNGIALDINDEEARKIEDVNGVKSVSPNYKLEPLLMDSVPLIQRGITAGKLDEDGNDCTRTGKLCLTGEGVTIGIIDTGVDYTHGDLGRCTKEKFLAGNCDKVIGGYDFSDNDNDPMDDNGHGTHVAATAAGNGVLKGVAPDAKIYAFKVCNRLNCWENNVISSLEMITNINNNNDERDDVDIVSMSMGAPIGNPDSKISRTFDNIVLSGVTAVIAAGNEGLYGSNKIRNPGTARKVITVGASNKQNKIAGFSSRGPVQWKDEEGNFKYLIKPDIVAPGVSICAAQSSQDTIWQLVKDRTGTDIHCIDNEHIAIQGTSMATPHVSGAVALLKQKHSDWGPDEIKMALRNTAIDIGEPITTQGYGRIDVKKAISLENQLPVVDIQITDKKDDYFDIRGTAKGRSFLNYELYYGIGKNPRSWINIKSSTTPIENELIYENFYIPNFPYGQLTFRLVVKSSFGDISNAFVVYEKSKEKQITTNEKRQNSATIYDNIILWVDHRNRLDSTSSPDIYMYDLNTGQERQITRNEIFHSLDIYDNTVIWSSTKKEGPPAREFHTYNVDTQQKLIIPRNEIYPNYWYPKCSYFSNIDLYDKKVVCSDFGDGEIYMYDLEKTINWEKQIRAQRYKIDGSYSNAEYPRIYKNIIVWQDDRNSKDNRYSNTNWDIYMYDLNTGQERQITTNSKNQVSPAIYEDIIVWVDYRNGRGDIYMYDLNTGQERQITTNSKNQVSPAIYEDIIVWEDWRNNPPSIFLINTDIYMYDLNTGQERQITTNDELQYSPKIYNNKIVWMDARNVIWNWDEPSYVDQNWDIYMYELETPSDETSKPQSKLTNPSASSLSGQLTIKLQKKDSSNNWQDIQVVVNQQVTIPSQGLLKLDTGKDNLGNQIFAGFNNLDVTASSSGDHRVYTRFENNGFIEDNWEFVVV